MNTTIEEQMEINRQACLIASRSKESAIKFLEDAGIIKKRVARKTAKTQGARAINERKNSNNNQLSNHVTMNTTIEEQIKTNHEAYLIVSQSKESAIKFLEDAGIIKKKVIRKKLQKQKTPKTFTEEKFKQ